MKSEVYRVGQYIGFVSSMLVFTGVLFLVTRKLALQTLEYQLFFAGFAAIYFSIRIAKIAVKKWL